MIRSLFVRVALVVTLTGCATSHVDPRWSPNDEAELARLREAAARVAPTARPVPFGHRTAPPSGAEAAMAPEAAGPMLEIHVFSIGQADSMLVIGPAPDRRTMLVDLGEPGGGTRPRNFTNAADHVLSRIEDLTGGTHVDYFVLSHYHGDHASGIVRLLSNFDVPFTVGEFIHVGDDNAEFLADENERRLFKKVRESMSSWISAGRVGRSVAPEFGTTQIDLGPGVTVEILAFGGHAPNETQSAFDRAVAAHRDYSANPANENDLSIAMEISAGDFEMFTAGDLSGTDDPVAHPLFVHRRHPGGKTETYTNVEGHVLRQWRDSGRNGDVEIYRANHHGSNYSTTQALIDALDPEFVLYSSGAQYGHPTVDIIDRANGRQQLVTTAVADRTAFRNAHGKIAGEIEIVVDPGGSTYSIEGQPQTARAR